MKPTRRSFIKTSVLTALGTAMLPGEIFSLSPPKFVVGLQLYSVREEMMKNPSGTLARLAKMGFVHVEHANYVDQKFYGYTAVEFKKVLDDLGLKMISGHTVMEKEHWDEVKNDFSDSWKKTISDAGILQQKYIISPSIDKKIRRKYDLFMRYMEIYNKCGELCNRHGMKFGYHNHGFEFSEKLKGETLFDIMMKSLNPELVVFQLDIGNLYNGGARAADVLDRYQGRFEIIHVKDEIKTRKGYESTILGEGIINCRNVVDMAAQKGGTTSFIIEQEDYQGIPPIDCVKRDFEEMKNWGY